MKFSRFLFWVLVLSLFTACSVISKHNDSADAEAMKSANQHLQESAESNRPLIEEKYSPKADREQLEEIRKQIPADVKRENDEFALMMKNMGEVHKHPSDVRSDFDKVMRKKREVFQKDATKQREDFSRNEKKTRDEFLKGLDKEKEDFKSKKVSTSERKEFFESIERRRQDYFSNEREKRSEFDSDLRAKRSDFEDHMRELTNEFNQEHRAYQKRYDNYMKQKEKQQQE